MQELIFKISFYMVFFGFAYIMSHYSRLARSRQAGLGERLKAHDLHEVPLLLRLRQVFGIPFYLGVLAWTFLPASMSWSSLPLPPEVRWGGLGLGLLAVALNAWSHQTLRRQLGDSFDPALRLLRVPALVMKGPYARLRHPIYLAFLLMQVSVLLLTANWFIGGCGLAIILAVLAIRVPEEERILGEQFGDTHAAYVKSTGAILPKFQRGT